MNLNEYQQRAISLATYPQGFDGFMYTSLKLAGESGEFAEHVGKAIRDDNFCRSNPLTEERRNALLKELGDVLWYVAANALELGYDLNAVALMNLGKLEDRKARGVLGGSGDNR